jgi:hypothetical protein
MPTEEEYKKASGLYWQDPDRRRLRGILEKMRSAVTGLEGEIKRKEIELIVSSGLGYKEIRDYNGNPTIPECRGGVINSRSVRSSSGISVGIVDISKDGVIHTYYQHTRLNVWIKGEPDISVGTPFCHITRENL